MESEPLQALYRELADKVRAAGFGVEARRYTPHLTLVRGARLREGFDLRSLSQQAGPMTVPVTKLSLMKSERLAGRLAYTEIR
jgi:2'-5' RNA ligase